MAKLNLSWDQKLTTLKPFVRLGSLYNKKPENLTKSEKQKINYYLQKCLEGGLLEFNKEEKKIIQKSGFQEGAKTRKGSKLKGRIVQGASPGDKIRGNKIIRNGYDKIFIPLDLEDIELESEDYEAIKEAVADELSVKLDPYYSELQDFDYFTIRLIIGWEVGQNKRARTPIEKRREGRAMAKGADPERKMDILTEKISELVSLESQKYSKLKSFFTKSIVDGVYLWSFKDQREPTEAEKKIASKKKRAKRA